MLTVAVACCAFSIHRKVACPESWSATNRSTGKDVIALLVRKTREFVPGSRALCGSHNRVSPSSVRLFFFLTDAHRRPRKHICDHVEEPQESLHVLCDEVFSVFLFVLSFLIAVILLAKQVPDG